MRTLTEIAATLDTDKGSHATAAQSVRFGLISGHEYTLRYEAIFAPWREKAMALLELGVGSGGSLRLWAEAFPLGEIHGVEVNVADIEGELPASVRVWLGNAVDRDLAEYIAAEVPDGFDIVIDDASHLPRHQTASLRHYFRQVRAGGVYIIEDVAERDLKPLLAEWSSITGSEPLLIPSALPAVCAVGFWR